MKVYPYVKVAMKRKGSLLIVVLESIIFMGLLYGCVKSTPRTITLDKTNSSVEVTQVPSPPLAPRPIPTPVPTFPPTPSVTEKRVALVIGNSAYKDVPLQNPTHDAEDISRMLRVVGFTVITKTNLNQRTMEETINEFFQQIQQGDVALFYYSGHGSQVNGENYLLPVGENIQSESDIRYKAVNVGYILGKMEESGTQTNIIILDACRNNPFKGIRSLNNGLTVMNAPGGTFLAYATAPNSVAFDDGTARNSIYTKYLLEALQVKGLPIEQAFKRVLKNVEQETNGRQIPWISSSLRENFIFNP